MRDASPQPTPSTQSQSLWDTTVRILTFRSTREELLDLGYRHLAFGLVCTLIVGIGRYWDNDRVAFLQRVGVGSVIYVVLLSLLLFLLVYPLRPKNWYFPVVAAFVALLSPPAIVYAFPVEYLHSVELANTLNVYFFGVLAAWRVALLAFLLRRLGELAWAKVVVLTLLPMCIILLALYFLNLEHVVFNFAGGFREMTASDSSHFLLLGLSYMAMFLIVPVLIAYGVLVAQSISEGKRPSHWPEWMDE